MRDLPPSRDLLALARELLLGDLASLLPPERARDAHLVATAIAIALREGDGGAWQAQITALIADLYGACGAVESGEAAGGLDRLAVDLRNGAFENSPSRAAAARAILWRLTIAKLRENNPHFLAANGFDGDRSE